MKRRTFTFFIMIVTLLLFPSLLFAQTSYEDQLKQKLNEQDPLTVIAENTRFVESLNEWFVDYGEWEVRGDVVKFIGPKSETEPGGRILYTKDRFWNGIIEFTVSFSEQKEAISLVFDVSPLGDFYTVTIPQGDSAYSLWQWQQVKSEWQNFFLFGQREDLLPHTDYHVRLQIDGSQVTLHVNGIKVFSRVVYLSGDIIGLRTFGTNPIEFKNVKIQAVSPFEFLTRLPQAPVIKIRRDSHDGYDYREVNNSTGLQIRSIQTNSPYHGFLQEGDILVAVEGAPYGSSRLRNARRHVVEGNSPHVFIGVERKGQMLYFKLVKE